MLEKKRITNKSEEPKSKSIEPIISIPRQFPPLTQGKKYVPPMQLPNLKRICFTGGPCGGKTTSLNYISQKLRDLGYAVLIVPEAPTIIACGGGLINIQKMDAATLIRFQNTVVRFVIDMEDDFSRIAEITGKPSLLLCDRGSLDPRAYMTPVTWQSLLDDNEWNVSDLRDNRYHGVLHLVSVADGASEHYSIENNAARYENTVELATSVDINTRNAWIGHHSFLIIDNSAPGGWEGKLKRVDDAVMHFIGKLEQNFYKKYLIKKGKSTYPEIPEDIRSEEFDLEDTFLFNNIPHFEEKITKRSQKGALFFSHFTRNRVYKSKKNEDVDEGRDFNRIIAAGEYQLLKERQDDTRITLTKHRQYFIWERTNLFIDTFTNAGDFSILYVEYNRDLKTLRLPETIEIVKEVTSHNDYSSFALAKLYKNKSISTF